jgi:hypothetical protein
MTEWDPIRGCSCMVVIASAVVVLLAIGGIAYFIWSRWPSSLR